MPRQVDPLLPLLSQHYGRSFIAIEPLAGEVDLNYRLETAKGEWYTLKISAPNTELASIRFQTDLLNYLAKQTLPFALPLPVANLQGQYYEQLPLGELGLRWLRLQTWVAGRMLSEAQPRTYDLLEQWGQCSGHLSRALSGFNHADAPRSYKWNPSQTLESRPFAAYFTKPEEQAIGHYFWELFIQTVLPRLPQLRTGINYNDAHEHNLLLNHDPIHPRICGLIDVGDAMHTQTINELAIACAYAAMYWPDPLGAMCQVVAAHHQVFPLEEVELAVLFPLIAARLLITVSQSARSKAAEPENTYLQVSEAPAWALLEKLYALSPVLVAASFRHACAWPALAQPDFKEWANRHRASFHPLLVWGNRPMVAIDCRVGSLDLGNYSNYTEAAAFEQTIGRMIAEKGGQIGLGGYNETRPFYTTTAYQTEGNVGPRWRTTHLGYDCWMPAGEAIYAPLAGEVHSFAYDEADRSYGATIILAHRPADYPTFYTLYGHLSRASLDGLEVGQSIAAGQAFAAIGNYADNGGWPPHLHFQVLLDTLGNVGDFPGVAYPEEAAVWLELCPDPRLLIPDLPDDLRPDLFESSAEKLLAARKKRLGYSLSVSYTEPLHIVRGWGQYLLDTSGRRYLDTVNNVAHVGHEHPQVVRAGQRQMAVLNTNTRYLHEEMLAFAEELCATLPAELSVVHFVNSGSEANELALRMASNWAGGSRNMLAIEVGYHGNTGRTIEISSYKFDGKGGAGRPPHTELLPLPDVYRGLHREVATAGKDYAAYAQAAIARIAERGERLSGFIAESILSCGGQIVLPAGYLQQVYAMVRAAGGLCIADEVQVGLGRVGSHWWGFELQGVVPDIVTIGKPIGNGHPLGAVVCTPAVAAAFANGMEYFNTFGGNPVSCAIGRAVLQVVRDEGLRENALHTGAYLQAGLQALQADFPIIGCTRGQGFFLGAELVKDPASRLPAKAQAAYLTNRMRQLGFLMSTDGPDENVLKIKPPMCFHQGNADALLAQLRRVLQEDFMRI